MSEDKDEVKRSLGPKEDKIVRDPNNRLFTVLTSYTEENAVVVEELLNLGADVNAADENGNTPLHIAVQRSQIETVKLLLKKGANLETANVAGITPLQMAASDPNSSLIFQLLLENGANLYAVDQHGNTALHAAAIAGNILVIEKILIENPCFHKIKNHLGDTPLHVAVHKQQGGSIDTLIFLGADQNAENKLGQQFEGLKSPSILVSSASLKNLEGRLLAECSYSEAFTNWVHENPGWAAVIAVSFFWVLFVPTISIIAAALSKPNSSKKPVKNFVNEFAVAAINGELYIQDNLPLENAFRSLPNQQMKDVACDEIRESTKALEKVVFDQETQIKEILLRVFNDAPSSFLWKKKLTQANLLQVKKTQNGECFLIFVNTYESSKEDYVAVKEEECQYEATFFADFVRTVFEATVTSNKEDISSSDSTGARFTCSVNVSDIYHAKVNKEALHNYYQSFEVLAVFKEAIEDWAQNKEDQLLAKSINAGLKVSLSKDSLVVYSKFLDKYTGAKNDEVLDSEEALNSEKALDSEEGSKAKKEELEKKSEGYRNSIDSLNNYLTQRFGQKVFTLSGKSAFTVDNFTQEITLIVAQKNFKFIFGRKKEETHLEPEIFTPVFDLGKQHRQNTYLSEEQQQNKQFSELLKLIFSQNQTPLIKKHSSFLGEISCEPVIKNGIEYFELYSANCSSIELLPDAYPLNLFQKVQALVNEYFAQFPCAEVLDLDVNENSQSPQLKLLLRRDRLNHLLEWSEKKKEAEKVRDILNGKFQRNFGLGTIKNGQYPDGTLFLVEQIKGKNESNRNMQASEAAFKANASLSNKRPRPKQFVKAESRGDSDSHQAFVCVYPNEFPRILEIMQANDRNLSL